jgi:hypothetical protein
MTAPEQSFENTSAQQIQVNIGALTSQEQTGGIQLTSYELWRDDGRAGDFTKLSSSLGTQFTDLQVQPHLLYRYKYRAENQNGFGEFSDIGYLFASDTPSQSEPPQRVSFSSSQI